MRTKNDFLIEIGTEELPPKDLEKLSLKFAENITSELNRKGINYSDYKTYATPRRLAVIIKNIDQAQPSSKLERKGPAIKAAFDENNNPTPAAIGFAKSCNVTVEELQILENKSGSWLYFEQKIPGVSTKDLLPEVISTSLDKLPIKKRMKWSNLSYEFVRPVHWVLSLYNNKIVPMEVYGIKSGKKTYGHRFMHNAAIEINDINRYESELKNIGKIIPDYQERKAIIKEQLINTAKNLHAKPIIDKQLLNEVTALVEYPVILAAKFKEEFLSLPKEVLISAMQEHQRCFGLEDDNKNLKPYFILVSNIESKSPQTIIAGNERVMHARLADAAFYYKVDQNKKLSDYTEQLKNVIFQKKLGTLYNKVIRISNIATAIAKRINVNQEQVKQAAMLAKADLMTQMVYEFPELQGIMGYYYAKRQGINSDIALAIKDHYLPNSATSQLPSNYIGVCLSLADKLDSLVGIFGINKKPSGEKDPFALRRQAIGILRILKEKAIDIDIKELIELAKSEYDNKLENKNVTEEVFDFCMERLKNWYQTQGVNPAIFHAAIATKTSNIVDLSNKISAICNFIELPEAKSLTLVNKRVKNILNKNNIQDSNEVNIDESLLKDPNEEKLFTEIKNIENGYLKLEQKPDYFIILKTLTLLEKPLENFFDNVMVMCEDEKLRNNRIKLLQKIRNNFLKVADISLL